MYRCHHNVKTSTCIHALRAPTCIPIPPYSSRTAPIHQYTPKQSSAPTDSHQLLRMNVIAFETCWAIKNFHKVTSSWFNLFNKKIWNFVNFYPRNSSGFCKIRSLTECEGEKNGYFQENIVEENRSQSLLRFEYWNFIYGLCPLRHCHTHNFSHSIQPDSALCS